MMCRGPCPEFEAVAVSADVAEGKGGLVTHLILAPGGKTVKVAVGCAHFDSKNPMAREYNACKMMKILGGLKEVKCSTGKGDIAERAANAASIMTNFRRSDTAALLLAGDLNYRAGAAIRGVATYDDLRNKLLTDDGLRDI